MNLGLIGKLGIVISKIFDTEIKEPSSFHLKLKELGLSGLRFYRKQVISSNVLVFSGRVDMSRGKDGGKLFLS